MTSGADPQRAWHGAIPGAVDVPSSPTGPSRARLGAVGVTRITVGSSLVDAVSASLADRAEGPRR